VSIPRILLLAGVTFSGGLLAFSNTGPPKLLEGKVVVLDPGHAVIDARGVIVNPGSRARKGAYERDVVLHVAETMVPLLEAQGARVFLTRTSDNPWRFSFQKKSDNRARAILANLLHADAYVRIHCDWNRDRRFNGYTTYYYRWQSREMAQHIHDALAKVLSTHRDNGIHRRSFVSVTAQMPAVLVELGVLSNKKEGQQMGDPAYQASLAMALAEGITGYFEQASRKQ
jgi:N-acetylmuramoyl-L-alanine amidase